MAKELVAQRLQHGQEEDDEAKLGVQGEEMPVRAADHRDRGDEAPQGERGGEH